MEKVITDKNVPAGIVFQKKKNKILYAPTAYQKFSQLGLAPEQNCVNYFSDKNN